MFFLFNSINFIPPIYGLIISKNISLFDNFLDFASLIGKSSYFLCDNIQLLSEFKLLPINKNTFDSIGVMSMISSLLIDLGRKGYQLYCLLNDKEENKNEIDLKLNNKIFHCFLQSTAVLGDLLTLLNYSGLLKMALGKHSMFIGAIGGLWYGIVNLVMTYSKINNVIEPEIKDQLKEESES